MAIHQLRIAVSKRVIALLVVATAMTCLPPTGLGRQASIDFPYQALVAKQGATVRSGPGDVHYGTKKLDAGDVVEVYRHDPGGWCAIRPTKGSFCIIPESTIEIVEQGVGVVVVDSATPYVGTELGAVEKPLWQVKLREDERVSVLGQLSWPNPEGHSTIWYQIEPPAGEFRWIHISDIQSLDPPAPPRESVVSDADVPTPTIVASQLAVEVVAAVKPPTDFKTSPNPTGQWAIDSNSREPITDRQFAKLPTSIQPVASPLAAREVQQAGFIQPSISGVVEPNEPPLQDTGSGWRKATGPIPREQPTLSSRPSSSGQASQQFSEPARDYSPAFDSSGFSSGFRVADARSSRDQFTRQLNEVRVADGVKFDGVNIASAASGFGGSGVLQSLNNRLTMEMLKEPVAWDLGSLENTTQQFLISATPAERIEAQRFLDKLADCRKIAAGYRGPQNSLGFGGSVAGSSATAGSGNRSTVVGGDSSFDAVGWLNELKQASGTAPSTYVLQDESGKIVFHVTPIPGLNINRYLKQKVGISGQRGFNQRLRLNHIAAERVFPL